MQTYSLKDIKIAVINEDLKTLEKLSKQEPSFASVDEAKEILSYINLAKEILKKEKLKLFKEMQEIKKLKEFHQKEIKNGISFKM